jgi:SAM-dependent methyltransferase
VCGYEPSAAPRAAAAARVRELIVHDVFDARHAAAGGPYDLITCCMTIEHVPDPAQLCRDANDLLVPGGALMLVCHDRRAPLNRALGMRSPIIDIEHLQLFSQASARALLGRTGYRRVAVRRFANRYPLHYWLKLAPVPRGVKGALVAGARRGAVRRLAFPLPVGNLAVVGFRP